MKHQLDNCAIVSRMQQACNARSDAQLARFLQETSSAVSTWRKAKSPPFSACYTVSVLTGCNMEWLLHGDKPPRSLLGKSVRANLPSIYVERFASLFSEYVEIASRLRLFSVNHETSTKDIERFGRNLFEEFVTSSTNGEFSK
ncbi:helix-turn-helix domain-containing protein [Alteromonas sp. a30]|uniref:helix-turn-helix domain-containing protein n=1 Tax=Alteromonas sp. a30 TaxID=2730917 RepID=UPI00227DAD70|nr:helix-turn-helix domain-containing protein [Alteromonas sp. a30]MCY7295047.1 hypothetical protein [Alteromonas sp. a30]